MNLLTSATLVVVAEVLDKDQTTRAFCIEGEE